MLCEKQSVTEEKETKDVQNSGLKTSNQGVIFTQATLFFFRINAVQNCVKCMSYLYQQQHWNSCAYTGALVKVEGRFCIVIRH